MGEKMQLGQIKLNVNNLELVSGFYERLGFQTHKENNQITLSIDHKPLLVLYQTNLPRKNEVGLYHLGLKVPTSEAFIAFYLHLKKERIKVLGTAKYSCMESIYFSDPEYNGIELYVDLPLKYKGIETKDRTVMNPLNLKQMVEKYDNPPSSLPKETVIGRIHLHVLKLEESESYYQKHLGLRVSYKGSRDSYLSKDQHENYLGLNTWLSGSPASKEFLSPGLRGFTIYMESSLFDDLYDSNKDKITLIDPNQIHSTVFRGF